MLTSEKISRRSSGGMRVAIAIGGLKGLGGDWVEDVEPTFESMRQSWRRRGRGGAEEMRSREMSGEGSGSEFQFRSRRRKGWIQLAEIDWEGPGEEYTLLSRVRRDPDLHSIVETSRLNLRVRERKERDESEFLAISRSKGPR